MNLINNKNGTSKVMSVYWFAILVIVAGVIVYMVSIFYGNPYDVREIESNILAQKVVDCLSKDGKLKYEINEEFKEDFLKRCNLNFSTKDNEDQYYLEIEFYDFVGFEDFEKSKPLGFKIVEGNINLKVSFDVNSSSKFIFSSEKSFYTLSNNGEQELIVKVFSIISKTKENVGR